MLQHAGFTGMFVSRKTGTELLHEEKQESEGALGLTLMSRSNVNFSNLTSAALLMPSHF